MFEFLSSTSELALVSQLGRGNQRLTIAVERALAEHPEIGPDVQRLNDALSDIGSSLGSIAPDRSEAGFNKEAVAQTAKLGAPFGLLVESQRRAMRKVEADHAALYAPRFPEGSQVAVQTEQRTWARPLPLPKLLEATKADTELAAAIVEGGPAMSGLPADIFDRLHREMAVNQLAKRIVKDTSLRTEPTADDPIGGEPDYDTARRAAADRLDRLDRERELLGRVPALLSNVITAVALMTGETRDGAFKRLTAA